jgi:hypothetical protein
MNLNKLRKNLSKATAVAAVIGIATCLFPARAQAQIRFFEVSGQSPANDITSVGLNFSVGTSEVPVSNSDVLITSTLGGVGDVNSLDSEGEFPGSVRELRVDTNDDNLDLLLTSGTLRTSRLTIDPTTGNFSGLSFGYEAITDNNFPYAAFNNDGLRYDFTFDDRSETLTLFIPSNESSLINSPFDVRSFDFLELLGSLQGIQEVEGIQGVVSYPNLGIEQRLLVTGTQRVFTQRFVTVSEPTATASLLGVGALGIVSLLKRNKRLRKPV